MKKSLVVHPFLFAIYPVLFLFSANMIHFSQEVMFLPLTIIFGFTLLVWFILNFLLKDKKKAGLILSFFLLSFFSYGYLYTYFKQVGVIKYHIGTHTFLYSIYGIVFFLAVYFSIKTRRNLHHFTAILNLVSIFLVSFSLINIGIYQYKTGGGGGIKNVDSTETNPISPGKTEKMPDIYYIILDGYVRSDILKEIYHYENSGLLDLLTEKGFYIAKKSRSNYAHTALSLSSSLNLNYLQEIIDSVDIKNDNRWPLRDLIQENKVFSFLKQQGYKIVVFSSGYYATEIRDADYFMGASSFSMDEFQYGLFHNTPIPGIFRLLFDHASIEEQRIIYAFDHLQDTPEVEAPLFVFAHIQCPHTPFYFGQNYKETDLMQQSNTNNNTPVNRGIRSIEDYNNYVKGYRKQVRFIDEKIKTLISNILSKPGDPPIIILQGDHGSRAGLDKGTMNTFFIRERMAILNAYYFPDRDYKELYENITPVNTFRITFNRFFGTKYELLKDESFFSTNGRHLGFVLADPED